MRQKKNIRLVGFDYKTDGFYFITNNTHFSKSLINNEIKQIVKDILFELPNKFPGLTIFYYSIMPTHIHTIIQLSETNVSIPDIWRVFKSKTTVFSHKNGLKEKHLWQLNYFEHVIRSEKALEKIVAYVHDNPFKENIPFHEIYGDRIPKLQN